MDRRMRFAATAAGMLVGSAALIAQQPAASPERPAAPTLLRPFTNLFAPARVPLPTPSPFLGSGERDLKSLPSGTKCHIIVVPADPTIDPRMSIAPPASARFRMREELTQRICR